MRVEGALRENLVERIMSGEGLVRGREWNGIKEVIVDGEIR